MTGQKNVFRNVCWSLLALGAMSGLASSASASSLSVVQTTIGGTLDTCPSGLCPNPNVIGPSNQFGVTGASVATPAGGAVSVTINTAYAGLGGLDGTNYGSLFLNTTTNPISGASNNFGSPLWNSVNNGYVPGNWNYAAVMVGAPTSNTTGISTGTLDVYALGTQTAVNFTDGGHTAVQYYNSTVNNVVNGRVIMSNVGGNPMTYPVDPNSGWYFRQGQAVQFLPMTSTTAATGTWTIDPLDGTINFLITSGTSFLGNGFALSWAMTCANGILQALVLPTTGPGGFSGTTPLPAALPLFAGGLGLIGVFSARRKRRAGQAAAVAA